MAQEDPVWEVLPEAQNIIVKLCDLYPERIGHVDPKTVGVAYVVNKEPPENQDWDCKITGIKVPESLFSEKQYVIRLYKKTWEEYTPAQRSAMLMRQLLRVSEKMDGSLVAEDLKDHKVLVKAFGVDYMDSPTLPDLAAERQAF